MLEQKLEFAMKIPIRSSHFADRVEAYFGEGDRRARINSFGTRHLEMIRECAVEYWSTVITDTHLQMAKRTLGQDLTRAAVGNFTAQLMLTIFQCEREADWMKALARMAVVSWIAEHPGDMIQNMQGYARALMQRLEAASVDSQETFEDVMFVNELTLLQFEVISAFRTELEVRFKEDQIGRKGQEFVSSISEKFDASLTESQAVNAAAEEANGKISDLRHDTTQAAAISEQSAQSMQDAARAAGDLLQTLLSVTDGIKEGRSLLSAAVAQAEQSSNDNAQVITEVDSISQVLKSITKIADQTNILALNATIEAAMAGDAGAGFAVVAQEVKHLAGETAKATETVAKQVAAIQESSRKSKESCQTMVETNAELHKTSNALHASLQKRIDEFSKITDAVDETAQGAASIGDLVANIKRDTDAVSNVVRDLSQATNMSAENLSGLVQQTSDFVEQIAHNG